MSCETLFFLLKDAKFHDQKHSPSFFSHFFNFPHLLNNSFFSFSSNPRLLVNQRPDFGVVVKSSSNPFEQFLYLY